ADCNAPQAHPAFGGNLGAVTMDSIDVFAKFQDDGLWNQMLARDNISMLLYLHPDYADYALSVWPAGFTVQDSSEKPISADFDWDLATGETRKSSF
ncbi:MAG: hypothetical protein O3B65_05285, partial [Chloroflexi bacterium]|nr:hypothetical protein [Chloroflexota bacterium]